MTIFAILMPSAQLNLANKIREVFPADHHQINDTQWLISTTGTTQELTTKLGIFDPAQPTALSTGSAIVFATSSYFGRAPTPIWEWMKAKLETANG